MQSFAPRDDGGCLHRNCAGLLSVYGAASAAMKNDLRSLSDGHVQAADQLLGCIVAALNRADALLHERQGLYQQLADGENPLEAGTVRDLAVQEESIRQAAEECSAVLHRCTELLTAVVAQHRERRIADYWRTELSAAYGQGRRTDAGAFFDRSEKNCLPRPLGPGGGLERVQ